MFPARDALSGAQSKDPPKIRGPSEPVLLGGVVEGESVAQRPTKISIVKDAT
jgi:hypothetical protein